VARSRTTSSFVQSLLDRTRIVDRSVLVDDLSRRRRFAACRDDEIIQAASINSTAGSINARKIVVKISGTAGGDGDDDLAELYKF